MSNQAYHDEIEKALLEDCPNEVPEMVRQRMRDTLDRLPRKKPKGRSKLLKRFLIAGGIAAALALGTVTTASVSPTFAEYLQSIFDNVSDMGLREAAQKGLANKGPYKVTDQGITFEVKEVIGDPHRVSFAYEIKDASGKLLDPQLLSNKNAVFLTDENGNKISVGQFDWTRGGDITDPKNIAKFAYFSYELPEKTPDLLVIHVKIKNIGYESKKKPGIDGNWELQIPVDLSEGKKQTTIWKPNQTYQSPDGESITVKELKLSPTRTRLLVEMSKSDNPESIRPSFQITDPNGKLLALFRIKTTNRQGLDHGMTGRPSPNNKMVYEINYDPFPKADFYNFELKGYWSRKSANASISVANGTSKPVQFEQSTFQVTGTKDQGKEGYRIILKGIAQKGLGEFNWVVEQNGKEYYAWGMSNINTFYPLSNKPQSFEQTIRIPSDMKGDFDPNQPFTLKLIAVEKFVETNWKVQLKP